MGSNAPSPALRELRTQRASLSSLPDAFSTPERNFTSSRKDSSTGPMSMQMHAEVEKAPSPTNSHPDPKPELSVHETSDQDLKPTEAKRRVPEEWKRALSQLFIARTASPDPHSVTAVWPPCSVPSSVILHDLVDPPVFFSSFEDWVDFFFLCWPLRLDEPRENTLPIGEHQLKIGGEDFFEKMKQLLEANMTDPDVMEEHVAYLERLGVSEEDQLPPAIAGTDCFNPVLERFWKPWAKSVLFAGSMRLEFVSLPLTQFALYRGIVQLISHSVPTLSVLRYMIDSAPGGRILDVGAGRGYWSALLAALGADVVAVDDFSWFADQRNGTESGPAGTEDASGGSEEKGNTKAKQPPMYFDVQRADATEFIKAGGAAGRALFFSWPRDVMESCLEHYEGDTVFWVGEDATDMMSPTDSEWVEVHRMEMPVWQGVHDEFVAYKRRSTVSS